MAHDTKLSPSGASADALGQELKDDVSRLKATAEERAGNVARAEKEQVAKSAKSAASAIDAAADTLRDDENAPAWMASAVSNAAKQVDDLAGRLQDKSAKDIARETNRFGRENPAAFLAASAAVGFAAARFLRSGAEYQESHSGGSGNQAGRNHTPINNLAPTPVEQSSSGSAQVEMPGSRGGTDFGRQGDQQ
jgi:ElaB/YqjD/DUF883 family membrane-anchored ribosome-binding protein